MVKTWGMDDGLGEPLGKDGLNAARALILQAYYGVRRERAPETIGSPEILAWISFQEPAFTLPSPALIQLVLAKAGLLHRHRGHPRKADSAPLFSAVRTNGPKRRTDP